MVLRGLKDFVSILEIKRMGVPCIYRYRERHIPTWSSFGIFRLPFNWWVGLPRSGLVADWPSLKQAGRASTLLSEIESTGLSPLSLQIAYEAKTLTLLLSLDWALPVIQAKYIFDSTNYDLWFDHSIAFAYIINMDIWMWHEMSREMIKCYIWCYTKLYE